MRAITIKQPWASLIVEGLKDIENRTWATKYRGPVLIHASAKYACSFPHEALSNEQFDALSREKQNELLLRDYPVSAIIGQVDIVDCVQNHPSVWGERSVWNWVLSNPVKFDAPVLDVKGRLSFWEWNGQI